MALVRRRLLDAWLKPHSRCFAEAPRGEFKMDKPRRDLPLGVMDVRNWTIRDFLKSVDRGVDAHLEKISGVCEDLRDLLVLKSKVLKDLGLPVKHRKLITRYAHHFRLGIWKPRKCRE